MEQNKPVQPNNVDPKAANPAADKPGDAKVLKDDSSLGWKSHVNVAAPIKPSRRRTLARPVVLIPLTIAFILLVLLAVVIVLNQRKPVQEDKAGLSLQALGGDAVKSIVQAFNGGPKQVLTVNADTVFQNAVTFDGDAKFNGQISGNKGINVNGAASLESLNVRNNLTVNGGTVLQGQTELRGQLNLTGALFVNASGSFSGGLSVNNNLTVGGNLSVAGSFSTSNLTVQTLTINDRVTINGHIITSGEAPKIVTTNFAGSGSSARVVGNDTAGTIVIDMGSGPSSGQLATITFNKSFSGVPKVIITPVGMSSARLQFFTTRTAQNFTFNSNNAPTASTQYAYDYVVIE